MRLVSWNVHGCKAGVDNVVAQLRELKPDVICLQEVESGELDVAGEHEADRIAAALSMNHVSSAMPERGSIEEQEVILSRLPLSDVEVMRASRRRSYGVAAQVIWHGRPVRIVSIHLTSNATDDVGRFFKTGVRRMKEVWNLVHRADHWSEDTVLAGDFNCVPGMLELTTVWTRFHWASYVGPTHPSAQPVLKLDHVFYRGDLRVIGVSPRLTSASDHRPLVGTVRFNRKRTPTRPAPCVPPGEAPNLADSDPS